MKYFYTHLIRIESIVLELDKMDLTEEQKIHLTGLIDLSLYHTVLDAILSELSTTDKRAFLHNLKENNHDKIWQFLKEKVDGIEDKIKTAAEELKYQLHKDLREAKKHK